MIAAQLAIQAQRRPGQTAVIFGPRRIGYALLHERACRLARALHALGIRPGDRVAAMLHNGPAFFEALFGCAQLGAIFVPINFRLVAPEVARIIDACTPRLLIAGESFASLLGTLRELPAFPAELQWVDDGPAAAPAGPDHPYERWLDAHEPRPLATLPAADAVLMLMHSSGTTGLPKGIIFTHATTLASCAAKIIDFALTSDDVTVVFGPLFHCGPLMDLALPLLFRGGCVALGESRGFDPHKLLSAIAQQRGTVVPIYPTMLKRVLATPADPALDLSSLRLIITGGEAAPVPVIEGTLDRFPQARFINNYGSTEGGPVTTFLDPHEARRKIGSVGRESYSVQIRIEDEAGRPLGAGEVGELAVRSPFVTPGYWNRPAETAAQFRQGWWLTGDLAWRDDEGFVWIAGRRKDVLKTGGENVYPIEVEQVIAVLDGVVEVGVIGVPDAHWGEAVAAFVVTESDCALDEQGIIRHCASLLASFKKPRHVRFVDQLPRGTTNKVAKNVLRQQWASEHAGTSDRAAPLP
ncbi:MAG: AMP-binding protein [Rubrivivax sp.]|nr:AMP-binding protein [Rubrivivax sp.]